MNARIELHCHLDGSIDEEHASKLLGRDVCDVIDDMVAGNVTSLAEYLKKFELPISLLQTKQNLTDFSRLLAEELDWDKVIYAEIRFCPLLHTQQGLSPQEVVTAVLEGLRSVPQVKTNVILCMMRHFSMEDNVRIINLANEFYGKGVCALDLAGDEAAYPNKDFAELFQKAAINGIPLTIHAGEAGPAQGVEDALDFGADRIGHGVRAIENRHTIKRLVKSKTVLEVCPTSNIDTGVCPDIKSHPIRQLFDAGVLVTINTDNRTVSGTSLWEEYDHLKKELGFSDEEILQCNLNAVMASFAKPAEKVELCRRLVEDYNNTQRQRKAFREARQ